MTKKNSLIYSGIYNTSDTEAFKLLVFERSLDNPRDLTSSGEIKSGLSVKLIRLIKEGGKTKEDSDFRNKNGTMFKKNGFFQIAFPGNNTRGERVQLNQITIWPRTKNPNGSPLTNKDGKPIKPYLSLRVADYADAVKDYTLRSDIFRRTQDLKNTGIDPASDVTIAEWQRELAAVRKGMKSYIMNTVMGHQTLSIPAPEGSGKKNRSNPRTAQPDSRDVNHGSTATASAPHTGFQGYGNGASHPSQPGSGSSHTGSASEWSGDHDDDWFMKGEP